MAEMLEVISRGLLYIIGFFAFWALIAYAISRNKEQGFGETFLRLTGFHFWLTHPGAQIGVSLPLSLVLTLMFAPIIGLAEGARVIIAILFVIIVAIPIIMGITYLIGKERVKRFVTIMNSLWFLTIILIVAIGILGSA